MRLRLAALAGLAVALAAFPALPGVPPVPIPQDPTSEGNEIIGAAVPADPEPTFAVPEHPFMAPNGRSNIHNDAYQTDNYTTPGPLGPDLEVTSTFQVSECASVAFDSAGRIVTVCVGLEGPRLMMFHSTTLETLAAFPLPPRFPAPGTGTSPFNDFSGGGYFYLDGEDRAVIPTNDRNIWIVREQDTPAGPAFALERVYMVAPSLQPLEAIVSVLPDWSGRLWFAGTRGTVGAVDPGSGATSVVRLTGEVIANSFAVDDTGGVFIVSDHALYRFDAVAGVPSQTWRQTYDRGVRIKPGQVSQGSGTTPTLIGSDFVTITDNADPKMNVLVYRRGASVSGSRLVCSEPVFADDRGATDNSLIAIGSSIIVENNYGYSGPAAVMNGASTEPGITRVDFDAATGDCSTVWTSSERAPSVVPKGSSASGLVYAYTKPVDATGQDFWYLTALDFDTGATVWKRLSGEGLGYNNNYAPLSIGPGGATYVGALGGLVRFG